MSPSCTHARAGRPLVANKPPPSPQHRAKAPLCCAHDRECEPRAAAVYACTCVRAHLNPAHPNIESEAPCYTVGAAASRAVAVVLPRRSESTAGPNRAYAKELPSRATATP
jgi:hypothetical protein